MRVAGVRRVLVLGRCLCVLAGEKVGQDSGLYLVLASVSGDLITTLRNSLLHLFLTRISCDLMTDFCFHEYISVTAC